MERLTENLPGRLKFDRNSTLKDLNETVLFKQTRIQIDKETEKGRKHEARLCILKQLRDEFKCFIH